jgi:xanthine dehydrogenase molybdenum-binding subunit
VVDFLLNGAAVTVGEHPHLLAALREELDVTSPKDGCSPSGQCGCCTVLVDGKPTVACSLALDRVAGRAVTTLEGLDTAERDRYAAAFASTGALQCGFCTPGIVMRAKALVDKDGPALTRDKAARHLGGHLCRCTGYHSILDAVELLASGTEVEVAWPAGPSAGRNGDGPTWGVGSRNVRYEADRLSTGDKPYVDDLRVPGVLHAAVVLAEHARADVLAVDTAPAAAVPGVERVLTAADVPGELRIGLIHRDWPVFVPVGGRTSYLGDVLALVVAGDRATARRAAELVEVSYRPLTPFADADAALASDEDAVWGLDGNVLSRSEYARGDVDAALAASAHVVHEVFRTQRVEHAFLEPESTLAVPLDDGRLEVFSGGQGVWDDRRQIADVLGEPEDRVLVHLVANGGAFGGKEDCSNQCQTALAARLLGRPVKCTLSREESLLIHPKRHPVRVEAWAGCDDTGRLTALRTRVVGDSGPYASVGMKVLERAAGHASGPYAWPAIDVSAVAVRTNNPVCGAFRGFGANQAQFATEGLMDRLADAAGVDRWTIRSRNVVEPGCTWGPGQIMDDGCLGARDCLDAVRPAWEEAVAAGKAVGVGLGLKNSGLGNGFVEVARAVVRFCEDGTVEVRHCWTEMGQGVHTVALQVAVEELGVDPGRVRVVVDTSRELGAGQTTGSRGTLMGAGAVAAACQAACADGCRVGVDYTGEHRVDWTQALGTTEHPTIHSAFGYAAQLVVMDRESGAIERVLAAHDVGRVVNPLLCEGQIVGSVHMGLGYALSESFPTDAEARPTATTLRQLGILRAKDVPPIDVELIERPQPRAPYGIKGVGEIGLVPTAGAVAGALRDLDGEWRAALPMRREAVRARTAGSARATGGSAGTARGPAPATGTSARTAGGSAGTAPASAGATGKSAGTTGGPAGTTGGSAVGGA